MRFMRKLLAAQLLAVALLLVASAGTAAGEAPPAGEPGNGHASNGQAPAGEPAVTPPPSENPVSAPPPGQEPPLSPEFASGGAEPVFMFVQTARSGSFQPPQPGSNLDGVLVLEGVGPDTVYFSDRPHRIAGAVESGSFLDAIGFEEANPPNAAIVLSKPQSETQDVLVAELLNPRYDAAAGKLSYDVKLLRGQNAADEGLKHWASRADASLPAKFDHVSLFIDDCPDGQVMCYGIYQCAGRRCCRVGCGSVGRTVGYCWSWAALGCRPCQNYTYLCSEPGAPCDNNAPFCLRNQCASSPSCT
jgi:hypothetical protein